MRTRKQIRRMAMLLGTCLILELTCGFLRPGSISGNAPAAEASAQEAVTGADESGLTEDADLSREEGAGGPETEEETGAEIVPGSEDDAEAEAIPESKDGIGIEAPQETEDSKETEAAPETENDKESEKVPEAGAVPGAEDIPNTEGVPGTEVVPGAENVPDTRKAPEKETAAEAEEFVFECEGGVSVTARTKPGSGIPEDAEFHAKKLGEGSDEYRAAYDKVRNELDLGEGDKLYFVPFDVYFTDADGGRIEPESGLTEVTMSFGSDPFAGTGADGSQSESVADISADAAETEEFAVHILGDGTVEQLDADISDGEVVFEVESFSVMGPVKVVRGAGKPVATAEGKYYVAWDEDSGKLTFQDNKPEGGEYTLDRNYWEEDFGSGSSDENWRKSDINIKDKVTDVEFINEKEIELVGYAFFKEFLKLRTVEINGPVKLVGGENGNKANEMFMNCGKLESISGLKNLKVDDMTSMTGMFMWCSSLTELSGLENWKTSNVTDMYTMFWKCNELLSLDLSGWDTSSLTNMRNMFRECEKLTTLDLSNWNISDGTETDGMFADCPSLRELTVGDGFKLTASEEDDIYEIHDTNDKCSWIREESGKLIGSDEEFIHYFSTSGKEKAGTYLWGYQLTFNINDGDGDAEHPDTYTVGVAKGEPYDLPAYSDLKWTKEWNKDGGSADYPAVLAGWTTEAGIEDIILEGDVDGEAETPAHLSDKMVKQLHITPDSDITYYAMYAADENDDKLPDYLEHAEQVAYYANGGTMISGSWLDGIEGLFYRCGHHHVAGEEITLLRLDRGKSMIKRDGAVLLGWSQKPAGLVTTESNKAGAGIIETFKMPDLGDNESYANVYAVWAADADGDGEPDYEEGGSSSGGSDGSDDSDDGSSSQAKRGDWQRDKTGWWYRYTSGGYAANTWELIDGKRYYFNADGYMVTGWQRIGGVWYHLDETDGYMDTGWYLDPVDGRWYYFAPNGVMQTGWQLIGGKYYYLCEAVDAPTYSYDEVLKKWVYSRSARPYGSMYADETTPDGRSVDANGVRVQ